MQVFYYKALDQCKTCHPDQCVTQLEVASLITAAYNKAASIRNMVNTFQNSGCWPTNKCVFSNANFAASNLLNI